MSTILQTQKRSTIVKYLAVFLVAFMLGAVLLVMTRAPITAEMVSPLDGDTVAIDFLMADPRSGFAIPVVTETTTIRTYSQIKFQLVEKIDPDDETTWIIVDETIMNSGNLVNSRILYQVVGEETGWKQITGAVLTSLDPAIGMYTLQDKTVQWKCLLGKGIADQIQPLEEYKIWFSVTDTTTIEVSAYAFANVRFGELDDFFVDYDPIVTYISPVTGTYTENVTFQVDISENDYDYGAESIEFIDVQLFSDGVFEPSYGIRLERIAGTDSWTGTLETKDVDTNASLVANGDYLIRLTVKGVSLAPYLDDPATITIDNYYPPIIDPEDVFWQTVIFWLLVIVVIIVVAVLLKFIVLPVLQSTLLVKQIRGRR